ncbi:MAG: hypothetical protein IKV92_01475 [Akkermansia sp.]|nr:hypothetical protein [Akkermansia sp.]
MKINLMKCLFVAILMGGASCTNLCQTVSDWGAVYSGVEPVEKDVYYRHGGKKYVKGQAADYERTFVDHPYAIRKKIYDQFDLVELKESAPLYREIRIRKDGSAVFADNSSWKTLNLKNPTPIALRAGLKENGDVWEHTRRPTWHALYAYPLSVATFVCVDFPLNVAGASVAGVCLIPFIPAGVISHQQQQTVPNPSSDIKNDQQ